MMPASRSRSAARAVCSTLCRRPIASCTRGAEILHTETRAAHAHIGQRGDVLAGRRTRIDLDRDLGSVCDAKPRMQRRHDSLQLVWLQHGRSAAAKMDVRDGLAGEPRSDQVDLALQQLGIGGDRRRATVV